MAMERYALEKKLPGRLIPLPQSISAGCGLAWKTEEGLRALFLEELTKAGLRWETMRELS